MEITTPDTSKFLLPEGTISHVMNGPRREYNDLPTLITPDGKVASQWIPTPGELALLNLGVPVTLVCWTYGEPLQPVSLMVGGADLR